MKLCRQCEFEFKGENWQCPSCQYEPPQEGKVTIHSESLAYQGGGFNPDFFRELDNLESNNFWFQTRNNLIAWALKKYKPNLQNFLEVGCGTGFVLSGIAKQFERIQLTGSEIFLSGLQYAVERVPDADFLQMDARDIPYKDEFDAIGLFDVLEHIKEDVDVLQQLHSALKAKGLLFIAVPQHPWLWSKADEFACHERRYTRTELEEKVRSANFEILRSSSFVFLLLPAMMLSRAVQSKSSKDYDPSAELKINSLVNKVFYSLMMIEIFGIKIGLNYPFGGSRLIVARKI